MKVLLVNPVIPDSYWSLYHTLPIVRRKSALPPLGLITVAAMLPESWDLRLVDLNVEPLHDAELEQADLVMLTGMLVQRESLQEVLHRCRALGVRSLVGGPYATALPDELENADHIVLGEAEDVMPRLVADLAAGRAAARYQSEQKPDVTKSPIPRFDLLKLDAYQEMALQFSRGCPFRCEFCDIIVMFGRRPRTKAPQQVLAELDALLSTGFRGGIFFVDDNFIGNKKQVRQFLPELAGWRRRHGIPYEFFTEASLNLADDLELVDQMTDAGFTSVFIGIESPSEASLKDALKTQNLGRKIEDQVLSLQERGLKVMAGFILGFDQDGPDIFDRMIDLVQRAAIPYAMVALLGALPNTPLYERLEREGRLRSRLYDGQFGLTNVVNKLPEAVMIAGYQKVLLSLYQPEAYFQRCRRFLGRTKPVQAYVRLRWRDYMAILRAFRIQGLQSDYRGSYWRFLGWALWNHPRQIGEALRTAAVGHHFLVYTARVVLPALREEARLRGLPEAAPQASRRHGPRTQEISLGAMPRRTTSTATPSPKITTATEAN